ncbi:MAG TPA: GGDEF domain-containing protein [Gemmatimonadales bacterium]|nr:GGDEF domain-containing protein [Gemmatimonadales bacterium]
MAHRATHDPLTDLPNRALFLEHLRHALHVHRRSGSRLALLFLDLNGFKVINDERGHAAGDLVLRTVAERVRGWLRTSDLVARLGGDEFVVMLQGLRVPRQAEHCCEKLQEEIARPIPLPEGPCRIEAAVGIALFPDEGGTAEGPPFGPTPRRSRLTRGTPAGRRGPAGSAHRTSPPPPSGRPPGWAGARAATAPRGGSWPPPASPPPRPRGAYSPLRAVCVA